MKARLPVLFALVCACVVLLPALAAAQAQIVGQVRDESGGVLPGVTVEAASPAIIERTRTAVTDDQGRYRIDALRPGVYKLTATLTGFSTVVREGIEVPSEIVMTINIDMKVGTLEESVTVSGQASQVDVQQATRTQVISRDVIDSLPMSRNVMSLGQIVPGLRPSTPDVGGSRMTEQVGLRARGLGGFDNEQLVEGMSIQSYEGASQSYFDDTMQGEVTISTAAIPADTSGGGIRMNSILRDGGNIFSGSAFIGGSKGAWVKDNVDDDLRARNLRIANSVTHIENFMGSLGGPIRRDKVWWLLTARHQGSDVTIPNTPEFVTMPDGQQIKPVDDAYIRSVGVRLTWQAAEHHKVSGFIQRFFKRKGHSIGANVDPYAGEQRDPKNAHHSLGNMKWTAPITNRWLLEAGYSWAQFYWKGGPPSGSPAQLAEDALYTPAWYRTAETSDSALNRNFPDRCALPDGCTRWNGTRLQRQESLHNVGKFTASYVTGSHNIKVGVENQWGPGRQRKNTRNGHLTASYTNNLANSVTVFNNPTIQPAYVAYDVGVFAQDSWTINRLTINPGLRVQWIETGMYESAMDAGRFAPARFIEKEEGLLKFGPDYSPRLSAVYDLFGNGRTALKTSWSKYYRNYDGDIAAGAYGRAGERSETRQWFDLDLLPGTNTKRVGATLDCRTATARVLASDCDGVAQDNEIGISPSGGAFANANRPDRQALNLERQYNDEFTAGLQHQLMPRLAVGWMMYKRTIGDLAWQDRTNISLSDYSSFQLRMPDVSRDPDVAAVLDANEMITVYNLTQAKSTVFNTGVVDRSDTDNKTYYTGFETSFNTRLPGGSMLFGSWTAERTLHKWCDDNDNPNGPTATGQFSPNDATKGNEQPGAIGGRFCDQTTGGYPLRHEFKFYGTYALPYGMDFGAILQSYPGLERVITWNPANTLFPNGQRTNSETFVINKPGSLFWERSNQVDVNLKKNFRQGSKIFTFQIDVFNVFNANPIRGGNNSVGGSLGNATAILLGRMPRLAFQMKF